MIISEFLPNPVGKDTDGEWIELFNNGQEAVNLNGWRVKDASGKTFLFGEDGVGNFSVNPGEYFILDYKTTKIALNNDGEKLFLYDNENNLADAVEFTGAAIEGESLIRQNGGKFVFAGQPTPGEPNKADPVPIRTETPALSASAAEVPIGYLNKKEINPGALLIGFFVSLSLAMIFVIIFRKTGLLPE